MAGLGQLGAIRYDQDLTAFDCGQKSLNIWLHERATQAQLSGTARTFTFVQGGSVLGYYSLATGSVERQDVSTKVKRGTGPHSIPVIVLARLAVDQRAQGQGLGQFLLQDALLRVMNLAEHAGVRAIVVDPIDETAAAFYKHFGFSAIKNGQNRLCLLLSELAAMA